MTPQLKHSMILIGCLLVVAVVLGVFNANVHADYEGEIYIGDEVCPIYLTEITPEPTASPEPTAEPTPSPTPGPTPEPTPSPYEVELVTHLGNIEAIMIFFTVVVLCYFVYRFLRLFI